VVIFEWKTADFLLFVYICISVGDPIINMVDVGIPLTSLSLPHFCACPKTAN